MSKNKLDEEYERIFPSDCEMCRTVSTAGCVAGGVYVLYSAFAPFPSQPNPTKVARPSPASRVVLTTIGVGLCALGAFNWHVRKSPERLREVNQFVDRLEDRIAMWRSPHGGDADQRRGSKP